MIFFKIHSFPRWSLFVGVTPTKQTVWKSILSPCITEGRTQRSRQHCVLYTGQCCDRGQGPKTSLLKAMGDNGYDAFARKFAFVSSSKWNMFCISIGHVSAETACHPWQWHWASYPASSLLQILRSRALRRPRKHGPPSGILTPACFASSSDSPCRSLRPHQSEICDWTCEDLSYRNLAPKFAAAKLQFFNWTSLTVISPQKFAACSSSIGPLLP